MIGLASSPPGGTQQAGQARGPPAASSRDATSSIRRGRFGLFGEARRLLADGTAEATALRATGKRGATRQPPHRRLAPPNPGPPGGRPRRVDGRQAARTRPTSTPAPRAATRPTWTPGMDALAEAAAGVGSAPATRCDCSPPPTAPALTSASSACHPRTSTGPPSTASCARRSETTPTSRARDRGRRADHRRRARMGPPCTRPAPPPSPAGWESLTPTQHRVAELAAQGLTNPQIGERMFISQSDRQDPPRPHLQKAQCPEPRRAQRSSRRAAEDRVSDLSPAQITRGRGGKYPIWQMFSDLAATKIVPVHGRRNHVSCAS